jgi:hypothetical protein
VVSLKEKGEYYMGFKPHVVSIFESEYYMKKYEYHNTT